MKTNPRFVLDTNILLVSISSKSKYHWIFQGLIRHEFELAITTDILSEYEEIISDKYSTTVAQNVIRTLLLLPNVIQTNVYYKWNLMQNDKDDDKFVDCAIASNADAIITHDNHFNILENIPFPPVKVLDISEFKGLLNKGLT
jgi:putative PIN family toxin of toxin-antitoxin system